MNLSAPFIHRPIGTSLLAVGLALAGLVAFWVLPVAPLPQVDFPTIMVQAALPGASPEVMATSVATPLETQLGKIAGITEMTSSSTLGATRIVLQFDLSRNIDGAARDVQAAINASASRLPTNLPSSPTYRKINPADAPIMIVALTSEKYLIGEMYDAASTILLQKFSQIDGIGQVNVGGSSLPAVRVELNPTAMNQYGIGLTDVAHVLNTTNVNLAKGQIADGNIMSSIYTNDQIFKAYQYKPIVIAYRNNNPVRLSDVADVVDSVQDVRNTGLANGKPAVILVLYKQPGANVIKTIDRARSMLPMLQASIPSAMEMSVMLDRTTTIRSSLFDVEITLLIAMSLVILVSYIFLGNFRAMLIPGIVVPLSLLGTFCIMSLLGYSLDNLSLMALTIVTGFVVDDAVVVLENITRHIEMGMRPFQAALEGAKQVGFTVLSMSLSLIAVFIPILFMSGIVGKLFREFSVTLAIAIFISMIISLSVTPTMCALILKGKDESTSNALTRFMDRVRLSYQKSLDWSLKHAHFMLFLMFATIALNIYLFYIVPKGFFPQQDTGRIVGSLQAEQDISFQAIEKKLADYVNIIMQDPAAENVVGFYGGTNNSTGVVFVILKDLSIRKLSVDEVIARMRKAISKVSGSALYLQAAQDLIIGGRQGNAQYQFTLSADTLDTLNHWGPIVQHQLAGTLGIADLNSDQRSHGLQTYVQVDRETASRFGLTSSEIDYTLYSAFGQSLASTIYTDRNQYYVVMEAAPKFWQRPASLDDIYVKSPSGYQVPLSAFSSATPSSTLLTVNHQGQAPSATLSFNLLPNVALGDAVNAINEKIKTMQLPKDMVGSFQGTAQAYQDSLNNEIFLISAALLAVYIVLGMLYESVIHPITILSTLPSAGVGALLALILTGTSLTIIALIGIILLIGIVKKNAIMMIDFALHLERTENKSSQDAIYEAALMRFRPIMMTTVAAIFGALPLVFGFGLGAELRRPLGIAIVGGLIVSQMLTLYTTPVIYLTMDKCNNWWNTRFASMRPMGEKG